MSPAEPTVLRGDARAPGGVATATTVTLGRDRFSIAAGGAPAWEAAYRDVALITEDPQAVVIVLGATDAGERWTFERFGPGLGTLARGLRDGRLRQWLTDGLVEIGDDVPTEVVEVAAPDATGPTQLLYHERGVALAPLDERQSRRRVRRADIEAVAAAPERGSLRIETASGVIELGRLGAATTSHERRWVALRDGAAADGAAIVARLIPDAPFDVRRTATAALREGCPADAASLGAAWDPLERAVLVEPAFAAAYRTLVDRAGGAASRRWLAIAPEGPGMTDRPRWWFLVGLPGNLVAMELVSEGAHATYAFRVVPRAGFVAGSEDPAALVRAVQDVSEALIDSRFLREPMAIPEARLAEPENLRYRLALKALPSLTAARRRFVARLVHRDHASWAAALDDLVSWHGSSRDDAEAWPGRADEEAQVDAAEVGGPGLGGAPGPS
jgi:hypothetical protein